MKYSILEGKRSAYQKPLVVFFDCEIKENNVIIQGYGFFENIKPNSKLPLYVDGAVVANIRIPEFPLRYEIGSTISIPLIKEEDNE